MAWEFDRPDRGEGIVQAFRRVDATSSTMTFVLRGLVANARYRIEDFDDASATREMTGLDLGTTGLSVNIANAPGAALLRYRKE
jgi:alpha-galactosidase